MNTRTRLLRLLPLEFGFGALLLAALAACYSPSTVVSVDAIHNPAARPASSYRLVAHGANIHDGSNFEATAARVRAALAARGHTEAADDEEADLVVEIDYGVRPPTRHYVTVTEPRDPARVVLVPERISSPDGPSVFRDATPRPTRIDVIEVAEKYLILTAREKSGTAGGAEVWRVETTLTNEGTEVAYALASLAQVAVAHINVTTVSRQSVQVRNGTRPACATEPQAV